MNSLLYSRRQPGGMKAVLNREQFPLGDVWWVAKTGIVAAAADTVSHGRSPDEPFATLVYAETQASADDTIFVMAGHTETLASGTGAVILTLDIAGLRVIGLGGRTLRPNFLIDGHANNYITITGADTVLENLTFTAGHSDIAEAIRLGADGIEIRNCDFLQNTTDENFLECINDHSANTCDKFLVEGCYFDQYDTSGTACVMFDAAQDRCIIRDNVMMGDWAKAIDGTGVPTNIVVTGNLITNAATDDNAAINLHANATGIVAYNAGGNENASKNVAVTASKCGKVENYFGIPSEDNQGILDPAAT